MGDPDAYRANVLHIEKGHHRRNALLRQLVDVQYQRNDLEVKRHLPRRGDTLEVLPIQRESIRISFFGDEIEEIVRLNPITGEVIERPNQLDIYAKHYV